MLAFNWIFFHRSSGLDQANNKRRFERWTRWKLLSLVITQHTRDVRTVICLFIFGAMPWPNWMIELRERISRWTNAISLKRTAACSNDELHWFIAGRTAVLQIIRLQSSPDTKNSSNHPIPRLIKQLINHNANRIELDCRRQSSSQHPLTIVPPSHVAQFCVTTVQQEWLMDETHIRCKCPFHLFI